ncbi:MAG: hypothetical protein FWF44_01970, partial [Defluviitaleaceae bacterium]|nr:hypothetical protein [Defluviitaleaceae bacterium]
DFRDKATDLEKIVFQTGSFIPGYSGEMSGVVYSKVVGGDTYYLLFGYDRKYTGSEYYLYELMYRITN